MQDLAGPPRRLGAQLGMLGVLHTGSRTLLFHPHIHYLIPGGGLRPDGRRWIAARPNYFLPVKALGARGRTLFQERLLKEQSELFAQVPAQVWKRPWNVDSRPAGSGENALRYLARYVFKTATSNRMVPRRPAGQLRWDYRESKTGRPTSLQLEPLEFMARFLQHILPRGFARIRTFGWLHPAAKVRAHRGRALLRQAPVLTPAEKKAWQPPAEPEGETPPAEPAGASQPPGGSERCGPLCPRCQKVLRLVGSWRPGQPPVLHPKRPP